jgi:hypothetical protein
MTDIRQPSAVWRARFDMRQALSRFSLPTPMWLRRFGIFGFLFFFAKGLLWLTVPALLVMFQAYGP